MGWKTKYWFFYLLCYTIAVMLGIGFRLLWRFVIFLLAGIIFYTLLFFPLPFTNPWHIFPVVLLLYIATAYFIIPLLVRLWRIFIKPNHIPVYALTGDGWPSDPVNIAIVCRSRQQLEKHMAKAGWVIADPNTLRNSLQEGYAILCNKPYPSAPMSKLYLFDRPHDIGFQIQQGNPPTPRHRHHVRFWQLHTTEEKEAVTFWQQLFKPLLSKKQQIWIGAATHDIAPFAIRFRTLQITHKIDSDTDRERDFLIDTLNQHKLIKNQTTITPGHALHFRGQTFGVNIIVDGQLEVVELK